MKSKLILTLAFSLLTANAFAADGFDRTHSNSFAQPQAQSAPVAADGYDHTGSAKFAEDGYDRTQGHRFS